MPDVEVLRKLRADSVPALLEGPPGTGKTSLIEAAFGDDLITVAGDGDTTAADLVGEYTQNPDGTFAFIYGPLVRAMQEGKVLFLDDATLISPAVLAVAYPAMDGRREITVKAHKGEVIKAAGGFYVVAGHNPGVHGAILTEALSSRFSCQVKVSTDYDLARALKIDPRAIKAARDLAAMQASGEIGWAPQLRELLAFAKIAGILGEGAAIANLAGIAPGEDADAVAETVAKAFGRTAVAPSPSAASSSPRPGSRTGPPAMSATAAAPAAPAPAWLAVPAGDWKTLSAAMTAEVPAIAGRPVPVACVPGAGLGRPACRAETQCRV